MKNIQVISGAINTTYSIYAVTDEEFSLLFPAPGQDIEFADDVESRLGKEHMGEVMTPIWKREVNKPDVVGIHGTLFYKLDYKKHFYPTKRDAEMDFPPEISKKFLAGEFP
jgi:hypothetical protein